MGVSMSLFRQCAIVLLLGIANDWLMTWHIQACAKRQMFASVATIVAICLLGYMWHKWFVERKDSWGRWWITVAGAIGAGLGTAIVIYLGE